LALLLLAIVLIPIGLLVIKPKSSSQASSSASNPSNVPNMSDPSSLGIPASAIGTVLDSTKWLDWTDFNVTYTGTTVGGLSVMVRYLKLQHC
jgi:glucan 1,3-beta-glucosidase